MCVRRWEKNSIDPPNSNLSVSSSLKPFPFFSVHKSSCPSSACNYSAIGLAISWNLFGAEIIWQIRLKMFIKVCTCAHIFQCKKKKRSESIGTKLLRDLNSKEKELGRRGYLFFVNLFILHIKCICVKWQALLGVT